MSLKELVGHREEQEILELFGQDVFLTPKPERRMSRVIELGSIGRHHPRLLGSGTTAAVAQKMGRRYIGIEMGAHAVTHCVTRLKKVIDGEKGGISEGVDWRGGGGFRFYQLGEPAFNSEGRIATALPVQAAICLVPVMAGLNPADPRLTGWRGFPHSRDNPAKIGNPCPKLSHNQRENREEEVWLQGSADGLRRSFKPVGHDVSAQGHCLQANAL